MSAPFQPTCFSIGGIIIDDIVQPNGDTRMAVLGGGAVHAAAGMWLWDERPGLVAFQGTDLPESALRRLQRDFDLQGLIPLDQPQARAWQIFEWDGRRTEIFRVADIKPFEYGPRSEFVPPSYRHTGGVHLLRDADQLAEWRTVLPDATLFWEPLQQFMTPANADEFRAALCHIDIVSPNWLEAQAVYGFDDPAALVAAMLDDGAPVVALRMGEAGSRVGQAGHTQQVALPAVPVPDIVDQTGAGNTYCGGFLIGWMKNHDLLTAARYGAVAASFALEVTGVADPAPGWQALRDQRYAWIIEQTA